MCATVKGTCVLLRTCKKKKAERKHSNMRFRIVDVVDARRGAPPSFSLSTVYSSALARFLPSAFSPHHCEGRPHITASPQRWSFNSLPPPSR
jgi:hypothetical protein